MKSTDEDAKLFAQICEIQSSELLKAVMVCMKDLKELLISKIEEKLVNNSEKIETQNLVNLKKIVGGFSPFDLEMTAINAYCADVSFAIPPAPFHLSDDFYGVSKRTQYLLFVHMIWDKYEVTKNPSLPLDSKKLCLDMVNGALNQGAATIPLSFYVDYVEALQATARIIQEFSAEFVSNCSNLVSKLIYLAQTNPGFANFCCLNPMIHFSEKLQGSSQILKVGIDGSFGEIKIPLIGNACVPGAGFFAINNLPNIIKNMQATYGFAKCVLNDINPFVAKLMEEMTILYQAQEFVEVHSGSCSEIELKKNSVGCVIISLLHNVEVQDMQLFLEKATDFLKPKGKIVVFISCHKKRKKLISDQEMENLLRNNFHFLNQKDYSYKKYSLGGLDNPTELNFSELMQKMGDLQTHQKDNRPENLEKAKLLIFEKKVN